MKTRTKKPKVKHEPTRRSSRLSGGGVCLRREVESKDGASSSALEEPGQVLRQEAEDVVENRSVGNGEEEAAAAPTSPTTDIPPKEPENQDGPFKIMMTYHRIEPRSGNLDPPLEENGASKMIVIGASSSKSNLTGSDNNVTRAKRRLVVQSRWTLRKDDKVNEAYLAPNGKHSPTNCVDEATVHQNPETEASPPVSCPTENVSG